MQMLAIRVVLRKRIAVPEMDRTERSNSSDRDSVTLHAFGCAGAVPPGRLSGATGVAATCFVVFGGDVAAFQCGHNESLQTMVPAVTFSLR